MALIKNIKLKNGVTVNYHRIQNVNILVNKAIEIQVLSYISREEREKELHYLDLVKKFRNYEELSAEEMKIVESNFETFTDERTYSLKYNSSFSIQNAYEYLKTIEDFANAEDD